MHRIFKGNGGTFEVTGEPEQGTTFHIYLLALPKTIATKVSKEIDIMTKLETVFCR